MSRLDNPDATSVYGVSVDSRSRPFNQPDNKYDIDLGRTLDRVKSIQLGSIQIPDCRYAFDSHSILQYSEPITMPPDTHLFIAETTMVCNLEDNSHTTTTKVFNLLLPPTLNQVIEYTPGPPNGEDTVLAEYDTGLDFAIKYYPLVGKSVSIVGGHFPQSIMQSPMPAPFPAITGPVLSSTTVQQQGGGYYGPSPSIDNAFTYQAGYLAALTSGGTGTYEDRHILFQNPLDPPPRTACAWSYIYTPKVTLVELFTMLNTALSAVAGLPDLVGTITNVVAVGPTLQISTAPTPHGLHNFDQVTITGVNGIPDANGTYFVTVIDATTFAIVPPSTAGAYIGGGAFTSPRGLSTVVQFGFNDQNDSIFASGPSIVRETRYAKTVTSFTFAAVPGAVSLAQYLGFNTQRLDPVALAKVPTYIIRTVQLRPGNYSATELTAIMDVRMNPLQFKSPSVSQRTLAYTLPGGTPASYVVPQGRYSGDQFADLLNSALSPLPAQINVTFNATTGKFTFSQALGLNFALNFGNSVDYTVMALNLGFEPVNYSGSSIYTSPYRAVYGVATIPPAYTNLLNPYPSNTYEISADPTQSHFTFDTGDQPTLVADTGLNNTVACPNVITWEPVYPCSTSAGIPWFTGDVLFAQAPFYFDTVTAATDASPIVVTTATNHGLSSSDNVTISCAAGNTAANGTWTITVTGLNTFSLDGSTGNGTYVANSATVQSNVVTYLGNQYATNTYTVVVQQPVDYSSGTPASVTLEPTVSIVSTLDAGTPFEALGQPNNVGPAALRRIVLQAATRDVFQLFFSHPDSKAANFGFPPFAWPPSSRALQSFNAASFPTYDPSCQCVPVASSYTSPYCWNLLPPDYILMLLCQPAGSKDMHTHTFGPNGRNTKSIFAKLYITSPYLNISEQMMFSTFAGFQRVGKVSVEFQNPDGTLVEFNGRPHSFELLFTLYENAADTNCF
jgi:hypothetical protein